MSIRALARDLYRARQQVDILEKRYELADTVEKVATGELLKEARREFDTLSRMLEGEKESGAFRQRFDGFGDSRQ